MRWLRAILTKSHWCWEHSLGLLLKWLLIIAIKGYQLTLSKLLMPSCRFYPSCSEYGLRSIEQHGAGKGVGLTIWRLLRCNPWNAGGLDPVPSGRNWRPDILPDGSPRVRPLI